MGHPRSFPPRPKPFCTGPVRGMGNGDSGISGPTRSGRGERELAVFTCGIGIWFLATYSAAVVGVGFMLNKREVTDPRRATVWLLEQAAPRRDRNYSTCSCPPCISQSTVVIIQTNTLPRARQYHHQRLCRTFRPSNLPNLPNQRNQSSQTHQNRL